MERATHKVCKRPTNVSLSADVLQAAKAMDINISQAAERGITQAIAEKQAEQWQRENKAALESSKAYVDAHGLPLARHRLF